MFFFCPKFGFCSKCSIQVSRFLPVAQQWQKSQTDLYNLFPFSHLPPFIWNTPRLGQNFPEITKLLFLQACGPPVKGLGLLQSKMRNTRKLVTLEELWSSQCKGWQDGLKLWNWACQTLLEWGNTSSTTPPHWGEDWVRRAGCEGKIGGIVLSAVPRGLGYCFLFSPLIFHTIRNSTLDTGVQTSRHCSL